MASILFVVGNLTLTAGNSALKTALETAGHTVTTRDDNDADKTVTGFDGAILASDTSSANLTGYVTAAAPLILLAHALTDDALMWTGGTAMTSRNPFTDLELLAGDIATASGVSVGTFTAFSAGSEYRTVNDANMIAGAVTFLRGSGHTGAATSVAAWYIPTGTTLSDGSTPAPGLRMFLPPLSTSAQNATTALLDVFVAAVELALTPDAVTPTVDVVTTTTIELDASGSTGTDPLTYDFTQQSGPAVTLSGTGATRTFERPVPLSEDIVIRVTVTGDDEGEAFEDVTITADGGGTTVNSGVILTLTAGGWE